jgi:hypothetical protein
MLEFKGSRNFLRSGELKLPDASGQIPHWFGQAHCPKLDDELNCVDNSKLKMAALDLRASGGRLPER